MNKLFCKEATDWLGFKHSTNQSRRDSHASPRGGGGGHAGYIPRIDVERAMLRIDVENHSENRLRTKDRASEGAVNGKKINMQRCNAMKNRANKKLKKLAKTT